MLSLAESGQADSGLQAAATACPPSRQVVILQGAVLEAAVAQRAILPSAVTVLQPSQQPGTFAFCAGARASWDGVITGRPNAADLAMTRLGRGVYATSNGKQYPQHMTRFAAPNGDGKGPHPAREPV